MIIFTRLSIIVVALTLMSVANCLRWHMQPNSQKCLREELRENVLVKGVYEVLPVEGQQIDYVVSTSMLLADHARWNCLMDKVQWTSSFKTS